MKKKTIKTALFLVLLICCIGLIASSCTCNDNPVNPSGGGDYSDYIYKLEIDNTDIALNVGESYQLNAQTEEGLTIKYVSTDNSVATVDAAGRITAVGLGEAEIVVSVGDFTQVRVSVRIEQAVIHYYSVILGVCDVNLQVGETFDVDAYVSYRGAKVNGATLQYASDMQEIATVDATGKIIAVSTGSANVTVSYISDGETKASEDITVTVIGEYTMTAELVNDKGYFLPGETLTANILSIENGEGEQVIYQSDEIKWISSDMSVARVVDGAITAMKVGSARVTVAYKYGASATFEINVAKTIYRPNEFIEAIRNGGIYVLFDDLDMTGYTVSAFAQFDGMIDGNYHEVKNLCRQAGTWSGNSVGEAALIKNITAGSVIKNIAFTDYKILGMAVQSGFVQNNNGTLENVVVIMTRDVEKPFGWEQPGIGLVCGSVLTWINNGTIKDCVVYNLSGAAENYAIAAAVNNGTIDGVYGIIEADDTDGDPSNNAINYWNGWRGTYNIGMIWEQPNNYGDYDSITATIGVSGSTPATNSVALTGFGDVRLADADFGDEFMFLVKSTFIKCEIPRVNISLAKNNPIDLAQIINPKTTNAFGLTFEYELADGTLATITGSTITGIVSGKTDLYVNLKDNSTVIRSAKMPCVVQQYVLNYNGISVLDMNRNTADTVTSVNLMNGISVQDHELSEFTFTFRSSNGSVAVDSSTGIATPVADGKADIYVAFGDEEYFVTTITVRGWAAISTPAEFMALNVATSSGYYYLTNDLDMTGCVWKGSVEFTGILDGNYHAVSNLAKQPGNWSGNAPGTAAFITNLTQGSVLKNIAFVNYLIFALYDDGITPMGMAVQSGFVQNNNGTIENVLVMMTRNVDKPTGWEQSGSGLLCGSVLTWKNNGTIKDCVVYNRSGAAENYAIAAAVNNGTIDGVYGFIKADEDGSINVWSNWRGTYNIGMIWEQPNYGDYGSITTAIGVATSTPATNSVALTGFDDEILLSANFNESFRALVNTYYKA